jgi:CcmD family protein
VEGSLVFLFAALIIVWLGIIGYLVMLSGRLGALQRELRALKQASHDPDGDEQR